MKVRLILASASPRRAELIQKVAAEFDGMVIEIVPSGADEEQLLNEPTERYAVRIASAKAENVACRTRTEGLYHDDLPAVVLGCDTTVALNGRMFGKPRNKAEAEQMLRTLCGNTHEVITGVCLAGIPKNRSDLAAKLTGFEKTRVTFGAYIPELVDSYIESGSPFDKAGGYGLQDRALAPLITNVEGDSDNVIGLPVGLVVRMFKEYKAWL